MNPFSRRTLVIIIGVIALSLAAAVGLTVMGKGMDDHSAGAHGYSVSAIGHRGLVHLLEKLDVPVVVSRANSGDKAGRGLLVIAEPTVSDFASRERLRKAIEHASTGTVLLVLPKWYGQAERGRDWLEDASFIPIEEVAPLFEILGVDAELRRRPAPAVFAGELASQPHIREPQLVTSRDISPSVESNGDVLVGSIIHETKTIWILTDPDVLNNYGLRESDNARFVVTLIDKLRNGGPVVIDETMHGYAQQPSLLRTLFRFPLVLGTMQVLFCALLAVWAAMVRFGPRRASRPPIGPGKDFLIRNTAALLQYGGHHKHALARYLQLTIGDVRRALHAPVLAPHETTAWLERMREVRKATISLRELEQWVETANTPQRVVEVGDLIHRWRLEMTHGIDTRT